MHSLLAALTLMISFQCLADWEGAISVKVADHQMTGKIHAKDDKQRVDFTTPLSVSTIVDSRNQKAINLIHSQKTYLEMDFGEAAAQFPKCSGHHVDDCLKKNGFSKMGSESMNEHRCDVYFAKQKVDSKEVTIKVWRPLDLAEVPAVRTITNSPSDGVSTQTDITAIRLTPQDSALFSAPKDYHSAGNVQDLLKNFKPDSIGTNQ